MEQSDQKTSAFDWLVDVLHNIFNSPTWESPLMNFIDENCLVFDAREDEGELHHTEIHIQFIELVEGLLTAQLSEIGLASEDFASIVMLAGTSSPLFKILTAHLLALDDFLTFKRMMNKRNLELELQAIQSLQRASLGPRPVPRGAVAPQRLGSADITHSFGAVEDDDEELRRAIEMSQVDVIAARRLAEMEESVFEAAIAESLLLEEQQQSKLAAVAPSGTSVASAHAPRHSDASSYILNASGAASTQLLSHDHVARTGTAASPDMTHNRASATSLFVGPGSSESGPGNSLFSVAVESATTNSDSKQGSGSKLERERSPRATAAVAITPQATATIASTPEKKGGASKIPPASLLGDLPPVLSNARLEDTRTKPVISKAATPSRLEEEEAHSQVEQVHRKKRELVQMKAAERARALEQQQQALLETRDAASARPTAAEVRRAVTIMRTTAPDVPLTPEPGTQAAAAPSLSMDERRRAMRAQLMQSLGQEALVTLVTQQPPPEQAEGKEGRH